MPSAESEALAGRSADRVDEVLSVLTDEQCEVLLLRVVGCLERHGDTESCVSSGEMSARPLPTSPDGDHLVGLLRGRYVADAPPTPGLELASLISDG